MRNQLVFGYDDRAGDESSSIPVEKQSMLRTGIP
jgi:hypothetical protein